MKCKKFLKNIISYQEDNLNPDLMEQIDAHLSECQKCREEYNISCEMADALKNVETIEKEDYFWNNLQNNIRAARIGYSKAQTEYRLEYRLSFWDRFLKPALIGFSFGVLLFAGYIYYDLTSGGFWDSNNVRFTVEDTEFYFNEHSMLENGSIFSQGELTPMLVSMEENENR